MERTVILPTANYGHLLCAVYFEMIEASRGTVVVEVLCYKPEGRGFETPDVVKECIQFI
jgi:hypothetical protein